MSAMIKEHIKAEGLLASLEVLFVFELNRLKKEGKSAKTGNKEGMFTLEVFGLIHAWLIEHDETECDNSADHHVEMYEHMIKIARSALEQREKI